MPSEIFKSPAPGSLGVAQQLSPLAAVEGALEGHCVAVMGHFEGLCVAVERPLEASKGLFYSCREAFRTQQGPLGAREGPLDAKEGSLDAIAGPLTPPMTGDLPLKFFVGCGTGVQGSRGAPWQNLGRRGQGVAPRRQLHDRSLGSIDEEELQGENTVLEDSKGLSAEGLPGRGLAQKIREVHAVWGSTSEEAFPAEQLPGGGLV